ncbi:TolC family protein [uncultured Algibacter sp.]|uniref:TolC family protein n=1 Tax=uncultured Algibacter sp. TaxID=298659 RepID=UPI00260DD1B3|nr:TolC family protein [uncultured Algibacter sp.]
MNKNIKIFLVGFLSSILLQAQQLKPISQSEVVGRAIKDNQNLKISRQDFNLAKADYRQTNAVFLPNISMTYTGISTTNPLMAFGSKLNQSILTQNDFNPNLLNNPSTTQNYATRFEIQQPLINLDGIHKRKAAKNKMGAMVLQTKRTTDYLEFEVQKAYMELQLAYKAVNVLNKTLNATKSNKKLANDKFKQGYLQRSDVLLVEVRTIEVENQLQTARSHVKNASNYISFLINDSEDVIYKPTDSLTILSINSKNNIQVSKNRADIKAMELASNAFKNLSKADKLTFLPTLNAFGSYELYDNDIFKGDANGYIIGAQLNWTLFEGYKRFGKTQKSKAEYEKSKIQYKQYVTQSQLELKKAKRALLDAENKLKLTSLALQQSEEALRIRIDRFKEGLEKTSDLLLAETQYSQKELEYYQTIYEYNYAQVYLDFLTKE